MQHVQWSYLLQLGNNCTCLSNRWVGTEQPQHTQGAHCVRTAYSTPSLGPS